MESNGLQAVRLYTSSTPNGTLDNTPAEVGSNTQPTFSLMFQAEAGDNAGKGLVNYTLTISALSTSGGTHTYVKQVLQEEAGSTTAGWAAVAGNNNGFVKQSTYTVNTSNFPAGDLYQFVATIRTLSGILSTVRSNEFAV